MTITEFLLARIAEDEEAAEATGGAKWDHLPALAGPDPGVIMHRVYDDDEMFIADCNNDREAEHIARHDPFRVLAECEAKRRIIEIVGPLADNFADLDTPPGRVLLALAQPYADHPDYRQEWRP